MNKKIIIAVVVVLLLLLGAGGFIMKSRIGQNTTSESNGLASNEDSSQKSLKDLIGLGQSQECTFSNEGTTGKVYLAGGKMRGDFTTTIEGETTISHMLVEEPTSYLWMDGQKTGYKFSVEASDEVETGVENNTPAGGLDLDERSDYSCKPWITTSGVFTLPTDVTFTEMSEITAPSGDGDSDSKAAQCAVCDSAPEEDRETCRTALKCD